MTFWPFVYKSWRFPDFWGFPKEWSPCTKLLSCYRTKYGIHNRIYIMVKWAMIMMENRSTHTLSLRASGAVHLIGNMCCVRAQLASLAKPKSDTCNRNKLPQEVSNLQYSNARSISLHFNSPGGLGLPGTRMSPFWILLELRMTEVVTSGAIRRAKIQSNCHY